MKSEVISMGSQFWQWLSGRSREIPPGGLRESDDDRTRRQERDAQLEEEYLKRIRRIEDEYIVHRRGEDDDHTEQQRDEEDDYNVARRTDKRG